MRVHARIIPTSRSALVTVIISINETNSPLPFVVDLAFTKLLCSTCLSSLLNLSRLPG